MIFPSTSQATGCKLEVDDDDLNLCLHESVGGSCQHVSAASLHLQMMLGVPFAMTPQFVMASHMRYLFNTFRTCASTRSWLGGILCFVCHHVEKNFDELENFKRSLLEDGEDLVMHGGKKRRRLDVDLINAITGSPGSKVAATTGVLLRTKSKIYASDHKSTELEEAYMLKHQASTWMGFSSARVVGLIFDAVRSGNPGVDNVVSIMINPANSVASYMPLTDLRNNKKQCVCFVFGVGNISGRDGDGVGKRLIMIDTTLSTPGFPLRTASKISPATRAELNSIHVDA